MFGKGSVHILFPGIEGVAANHRGEAREMDYSEEKVDEAVLALLWLTSYQDGEYGRRAAKGHDWDSLARLHKQGFIGALGTSKSITLSAEGEARARELFQRLFGK